MSTQPAVVINKPKSVWHSIFWSAGLTVVALAICGSVVSVVAINMVGEKFDSSLSWAGNMTEALQGWQDALPPALADAINDERDFEYADKLKVECSIVLDDNHRGQNIVVTVNNDGDKIVSLAAVRVTAMNKQGVPIYEQPSYAATPVAIEDEWRGPLLPGSKRTFAIRLDHRYGYGRQKLETAEAEVIELRTWVGPVKRTVARAIDSALDVAKEEEVER